MGHRGALRRLAAIFGLTVVLGVSLSGCGGQTLMDGGADVALMRADTDSTRTLRLAAALAILSHYAANSQDAAGKEVLLHKQIQTIAYRLGGVQAIADTPDKRAFFDTEMHYLADDMIELASMVVPKTEVPKLLEAKGDPLQFAARLLRVMRNIVKLGEALHAGHNDLVNLQINVLANAARTPDFADPDAKTADDAIKARAAAYVGWGNAPGKAKLIEDFNKEARVGYNLRPGKDFLKAAFDSVERACGRWEKVNDDGRPINCKAARNAFDCGYDDKPRQCNGAAFK